MSATMIIARRIGSQSSARSSREAYGMSSCGSTRKGRAVRSYAPLSQSFSWTVGPYAMFHADGRTSRTSSRCRWSTVVRIAK